MACAIVGTIIGMMTQTGVGTIFGGWVIGLGEKSLFLALVMTMLLSILLGTGIPTIPTYIITAALAAPALAKLGVPLIVSHMFAFYYGIMADLSPPVALAALAAAPIARENPDKIGWEAMRIALAGYVIPFIAVYSPALMLQPGDPMAAQLGFYGAVVYATVKALVAIGLFGMVAIGFLFTRMTLARARALAFVAGDLPARRIPLQRLRRLRARGACRCCGSGGSGRAIAVRRGVSLCLASAGVVKTLALAAFTLAWTHSIEKIEWQEDWRVDAAGPRTGRGARQGLRRRHGAAARGAAGRRLVSMDAAAAAAAEAGARQFRRSPANGGCAPTASAGRCRRSSGMTRRKPTSVDARMQPR